MRLSCYWQWISSLRCQSSLQIHEAIASWIHSYFDNVKTKFIVNKQSAKTGTVRGSDEVRKNCCLFEKLFKVKKNGIFLFGISVFVLEKFTFLYYANEESDDVIVDCNT